MIKWSEARLWTRWPLYISEHPNKSAIPTPDCFLNTIQDFVLICLKALNQFLISVGVLHISLEKFYKPKVLNRATTSQWRTIGWYKSSKHQEKWVVCKNISTKISGQLTNTLTKEKHVHACKCVNSSCVFIKKALRILSIYMRILHEFFYHVGSVRTN